MYKDLAPYFLAGALIAFLFLNILVSQTISSLYAPLIQNNRAAAVLFLRNIRDLPEFSHELSRLEYLFGKDISLEVFAEKTARQKEIKKLEQILKLNPHSRDALYRLSIQFGEIGDLEQSQDYLRRARSIDPAI